jgi:hypothetical protein
VPKTSEPLKVRWWKNGDHPKDKSVLEDRDLGGGFIVRDLSEGAVVGRHGGGPDICPECNQALEVHGLITQAKGDVVVHPGDWVVGNGRPYKAERP